MVSCDNCKHFSQMRNLCTFTGGDAWRRGCCYFESKTVHYCEECDAFFGELPLCSVTGKPTHGDYEACKWFKRKNEPTEWRF